MPRDSNFGAGDAAEVANIADVFSHTEIGVEAEGLREITCFGAGGTGGLPEDLSIARGGFHDTSQDLKGCGFAGTIGADEAEDFTASNAEINAADGFDLAVILAELTDGDGGHAIGAACRFGCDRRVSDGHWCVLLAGH